MLGNIISEKELGIIEKYDSEKQTDFIPCGSEGSLEYKIVKTGTENSLACRAVIITGDLRDYDDANEILQYFDRITKGKMIRSGILEIDIEGQKLLIYRYSEDKWISVKDEMIKEYSQNFVNWNIPGNKPDTDREILAIIKINQKLRPYIVRFYPEKNKYYIEEGRLSQQVDVVKWQKIPSFLKGLTNIYKKLKNNQKQKK